MSNKNEIDEIEPKRQVEIMMDLVRNIVNQDNLEEMNKLSEETEKELQRRLALCEKEIPFHLSHEIKYNHLVLSAIVPWRNLKKENLCSHGYFIPLANIFCHKCKGGLKENENSLLSGQITKYAAYTLIIDLKKGF